MTSFESPKSKGEYIGRVKFVSRYYFTVVGGDFNNGDGACYVGQDGKLNGFRINKVEGNRIYPQTMPQIESGDELYRNYDCDFERQLSRPDAPRRIAVSLHFGDSAFGFSLLAKDESGAEHCVEFPFKKEVARSSQRDNIITQLGKWGNTPFEIKAVDVELSNDWFVPSSLLSEMRRTLCELMLKNRRTAVERVDMRLKDNDTAYIATALDYRGNVANRYALAFYKQHKVADVQPAFELEGKDGATVMFCKHCIKYSMGWCTKSGRPSPYKEPLYIVSGDGRRFRLAFDCKECLMRVVAE
jgi:putative protease